MTENVNLVLQTERLVLRTFREEDWQAVHDYGSDPEAVRYMPWGPNTEQDTKTFIQRELAHQKEKPRVVHNFALIEQTSQRLIGACSISIRNNELREGEIGYILNRHFWNLGFMTEAAEMVVSFGFNELGLHRIYATCDPANTGSYRVMEKIGMQREGHLREHKLIKGKWRDSLLYSILTNEYTSRQKEDGSKTVNKKRRGLNIWRWVRTTWTFIQPLAKAHRAS
jgi:RimJ/RimL family protein N-acetyltransferase